MTNLNASEVLVQVINLERRPDRLARMRAQLEKAGLSFVVQVAVDGQLETHEPKFLSKGAIGCWKSHVNAMRRIVESKAPFGLILEDDADISGISLDIEPLEILINTSKLRIITLVKSPWSSWKKYRSLEVAKFPPPCASCYLINEATARYALEFAPLGVADWPQWAHKVKFFYDERFHVPIITSDSYIDDLRSKALSTQAVISIRASQSVHR